MRSSYSQRSGRSIRSTYSSKSKRSTTSKPDPRLPDRFSELYGGAGKKKPVRPRSSHGSLSTMKKFEELETMMNKNMAALKAEILDLKVDDYIRGS